MCYECDSGKYKGLTIVINNEINYQNLNIDSIKKLDKDIINRASSIHNIPLKYLIDKEKFTILEPFVNVCKLVFCNVEGLIDKDDFIFDDDKDNLIIGINDFILEPEKLPQKLALFQNLDQIVIFNKDGMYINNMNCVFMYEDKMLIFDGDSLIKKYMNIPETIKYLNIIPTVQYSRGIYIYEIIDYTFLPHHIQELNFNSNYLYHNYKQTNLPCSLTKLKTSVSIILGDVYHSKTISENLPVHSKIPHDCELVITEYY